MPMGWDQISSDVQRNWRYFVDFILNHVYYVAGVPVPEDPELAHSLRESFRQYLEQKSLMTSLIDFIDRFGANTDPLLRRIDALEGERRKADRFYMDGDYQAAWDSIHAAMEGLVQISQESVKLRRKALLWVYVTEYLTVTATAMISGFVIWTLMVKRAYYREIRTTHLGPTEE